MKNSSFGVFLFILVAGIALFAPMFVLRAVGPIDFWWWMSINLVVLITAGMLTDKTYLSHLRADVSNGLAKKVLYGVLSAVFLYGVFFAGDFLSSRMFDFAGEQISGVYGFKGGASGSRIFLLMLLIIGPGEELFWRVFVQRRLMERFSPVAGFLLATALYTGIHLLTGNFMLIMAALTAGLFWGWLYLRFRSPLMLVISHILWDISVFLIFPFN